MTTGFTNSNFDADSYVKQRPRYQQLNVELVKAWHKQSSGSFDTVLDMGCGPGNFSWQLTSAFRNVIGLDPSPSMLQSARSGQTPRLLGISTELPDGHSIDFKEGVGEDTKLPDGIADCITMATSAHWLPWEQDPSGEGIWKEIGRLLKSGGSCIFLGYGPFMLKDRPIIDAGLFQALHDPQGYGKYFEIKTPMSPTSLGLGLYYGIPKPSSASSFDTTQTRQILFNTSERRRQQSLQYTPDLSAEAMAGVDEGGTVLTPETPASAVPQWVRSTGIQDLGNAGLIIPSNTGADGVPKTTLRGMALYQRTASAWPRYLSDHPEEKELEKTDQDLFFRVLNDLRKKEAKETGGKVLGWDDEFEVQAPVTYLVVRKKA
ncbi:unnamed protein product [Jaminaea pallidilutea]